MRAGHPASPLGKLEVLMSLQRGGHTDVRVNLRMRRPCNRTCVVEASVTLPPGFLLRSLFMLYSKSLPGGAKSCSIVQMPAVKANIICPVISSLQSAPASP